MYYMEIVSIRFQEDVLKKMDKAVKNNNFNSRTEFIRDAVRDKLEGLSREELEKEFFKMYGKLKPKTNKSDRQIREEVGREFLEEFHKTVK